MYTYFYVLNDFGIRPSTLFGLAGKYGALPMGTDFYDASNAAGYGNSRFSDPDYQYWVEKDGKL